MPLYPPPGTSPPWTIADTTGLQAALDAKEVLASKGAANGYAGLDLNSQVTASVKIENRTSDPASPAVGTVWLRTDL